MGLNPSDEDWIFLKNTGSGYELEILSSLLEQYEIPVLKKESGYTRLPSFIMGESIGSYNIYVPASKIAQAREIIDNPLEQPLFPTETSPQEGSEPEPRLSNYRGINNSLLVLIVFLIILGLIIAAVS